MTACKWDDDDFLQSLRDGCPDDETWQQEFLCQPGDDESAFLSYDLIAGCQYSPRRRLGNVASRPQCPPRPLSPLMPPSSSILHPPSSLYLGVDIGRFHDLTVIWIVEKSGHVLYTRKIICLRKADLRGPGSHALSPFGPPQHAPLLH